MDRRFALVLLTLCLWPGESAAQVFGTFAWQMQPYCNTLTLTLTTTPTGFSLSGYDDVCGGNPRSTASGQAVFNPDGTVSVNVTLVSTPGGRTTGISGVVSPATGAGTWSDSLGTTGTFALGGITPGLPARPVTPRVLTVADNPNLPQDPCAQLVRPTMQLCGTTITRWLNGGYGLDGLEIWRDEFNQVHVRGTLGRSGGGAVTTGEGLLFILPPGLRPKRTLAFPIATGPFAGASTTGAATLVIYSSTSPGIPGAVSLFNPSVPMHSTLFFGELVFSLDQ